MQITLNNTGKKFGKDWIFRRVNRSFSGSEGFAILGANGSGKSTLLQVISGFALPTEGNVSFSIDGKEIDAEEASMNISFAAPYLELIEEFTLFELLDFHFKMRPAVDGISASSFAAHCRLEKSLHKQIRNYSSGMKQRIKLGLAFFTRSRAILLDEPTVNLDRAGVEWFQHLIKEHLQGRLLIVCSNHIPEEINFCAHRLSMEDHQPA